MKNQQEQKKAYGRLHWAVESGQLTPPERCEDCSAPDSLVGHHEDYSKPLEVAWICHSCHTQRHNPGCRRLAWYWDVAKPEKRAE